MSTSEHSEMVALVGRIFTEMGGRGTKAEVRGHVRSALPEHLADYLLDQGIDSKIGNYFRSLGDDGLPLAPSVDNDHTHVQLELLDVGEFRFAIASQMNRGAAARHRAEQYAARCREQHGVAIDIDHPFGDEAAS